ncbi:pilus assembly protein [Asticcacaulis sp. BYS171W]|uniref:Pilus assembly protein n=1 Tax=Asticcacaulis aquaticus TaxID=2984212 RepID=A0ABT5HV18_9CAUL|nr:pilus assembly protein [Asticcacaulis aquaticus]MDC7683926.1 pilus assembly protein [Asticcacaulis aquaticus]
MGILKAFRSDRGGNTAMIFGLTAFALLAAVGGGIDVTRAVNMRTKIQDASDAAVLRAATMARGTTTAAQQTAADQAFDANLNATGMNRSGLSFVSRNLVRVTEGANTSLTYNVEATNKNLFLGLIGLSTFNLKIVAEAKAQMRKSEIVFVLDSTGSMAKDSRMVNLRSSVDAVLAGLLEGGVNVSETKVGMVPFDTQVRVTPGTSYNWVDWGQASSSQSCSGLSGSYCSIMIDAADKVCTGAVNIEACRSTLKLYYKTSTSGGKTYYDVKVYAYEQVGSNYTIRTYSEGTYTTTTTQDYSGGTSCNAETGACSTTSGGTRNVTTTTYNGESGTTTVKSNLTDYSTAPAGYTSAASSVLTYPASYSNGYDGKPSSTTTTTTNGKPRTIYMPAVPANRAAWTGCFIDRTQPYDISADSPGAATASLYPARPCVTATLGVVRPLSTDIAGARTYVQALKEGGANSYTNITIGVQWGMEVLSPSEPMTGGVAFKDDVTLKYMIVVTDGENTRNRWITNSAQSAQIDARTKLACQAAQDKGITVFVIRVMEGNSALLKACASKPEYYYDLTNAGQLNQALKDVFEAIKKTRLTK